MKKSILAILFLVGAFVTYIYASDLRPVSGSSAVTSVFTRTGDVVAVSNDYTWAQINKATSDIADITTRSHTSLTNIGTNSHSTIDTFIASKAAASGLASLSAGSFVVQMPAVAWTTPAYNGGNFTASGAMTWTVAAGDVVTYQYTILNKMMYVNFYLLTTSIGGTPNTALFIAVPASKTITKSTSLLCAISNNGTPVVGQIALVAGGTTISISIFAGGNFAASTNNTAVFGQLFFEIN